MSHTDVRGLIDVDGSRFVYAAKQDDCLFANVVDFESFDCRNINFKCEEFRSNLIRLAYNDVTGELCAVVQSTKQEL